MIVETVGTCYEDAWRFLLKEEEGELIHGSVQLSAEGPRVNHAWVELPTGWVWEPQTKSYFTVEDFKIMAPLEEHRYSVTEAAVMLARMGKHGPWTKEEREQFLKRGNPEAKRYIIKQEPEPLYKSGKKYVAYYEDGTPRYLAAETEQGLKTRLLEAEPTAEFVAPAVGGNPRLEGVRHLTPAEIIEEREEMGTLADYTDDISYRAFLGEHTRYWDDATYKKAKAGQPFKIYRAVPTNITEIHSGAWVTQSRQYAQMHLERVLRGEGHIIEGTARANDLIAMSESEFFYAPQAPPEYSLRNNPKAVPRLGGLEEYIKTAKKYPRAVDEAFMESVLPTEGVEAIREAGYIDLRKFWAEANAKPAAVEELKEGNPGRVRFDRADIDSAIAAAKRLKAERDLYVFATYLGYTIERRPPPGMQQYVIVHPDGSTETFTKHLSPDKAKARTLWTRERSEKRIEILKSLALEHEPYWAQPWAKLPPHYREALATVYSFKERNPGTLYLEEGERIARQLGNGVIYNGSQMYHDKIYTHFFTDGVTGTTFACLDLEECKATLIQSRKDFGAAPPTFQGDNPMVKTEQERLSFHERIFGKGSTSPLESLGGGQVVNDLLPMPPKSGPPLPRALGIRWPWKR